MESLTLSEIATLNAIFNTNTHSYSLEDKFQDNALVWLKYDGAFVYCYGGSYGQTGMLIAKYKASSDLPAYQQLRNTNQNDAGSVPKGKYWIFLMPNPNRINQSDKKSDKSLSGKDEKIKKTPAFTTNERGQTIIYPGWGNTRAGLFPDKTTNTFGRNNFYLHDSQKGSSQGCIETNAQIFNLLNGVRQSFTKVALMVDYKGDNTSAFAGSDK